MLISNLHPQTMSQISSTINSSQEIHTDSVIVVTLLCLQTAHMPVHLRLGRGEPGLSPTKGSFQRLRRRSCSTTRL